jgi:hypothetical protein
MAISVFAALRYSIQIIGLPFDRFRRFLFGRHARLKDVAQ